MGVFEKTKKTVLMSVKAIPPMRISRPQIAVPPRHSLPAMKISRPKITVPSVPPSYDEEVEKLVSHLLEGTGILDRAREFFRSKGSRFLSRAEDLALSVYQKTANALRKHIRGARPLEKGEIHPGGYNYMGPGTDIDKYPNAPILNKLDGIARTHDFAYKRAKLLPTPELRARAIQLADRIMLEEFERDPTLRDLPFGKIADQLMLLKHGADRAISLVGKPKVIYGGGCSRYLN